MPITVTCPNASCGQVCAVQDQHAGKQVRCPKCGGVIQVPGGAAPANPVTASPPPAPPSPGPTAAGFMGNLDSLAGSSQSKMLLLVGLGCLAGVVLFAIVFVAAYGGIGAEGLLWLLVTLGAIAFVGVAILLNRADLYGYSLFTAGGWSAVMSLWELIRFLQIVRVIFSFPLFLMLLASLGAAGCFGYLVFQKLMKK